MKARRRFASTGSFARSKPAISIRPDVGGRIPARQRSVVVLPAPFGPTRPSTCAGRDVEVEPVDGGDVPVRLDESLDADHGREFRLDPMPRLQLTTAGESHGPMLTAILTGLPAGLRDRRGRRRRRPRAPPARVRPRRADEDRAGRRRASRAACAAARRSAGRSRSRSRTSTTASGRRSWGRSRSTSRRRRKRRLSSPRPGHADLAGGLKYGRRDLRDILERASARESAARVAAGALCRQLLAAFGIAVRSGVLSIGDVRGPEPEGGFSFARPRAGRRGVASSGSSTASVEAAMKAAVDAAAKAGDTLGGTILVGARGVPAGLGSHVVVGREARRADRAGADVDPVGEGGLARRGGRERLPPRLRARTTRSRGRRGAASSAPRTARAASRGGSRTARTSSSPSSRSRSRRSGRGSLRWTSTRRRRTGRSTSGPT